MSRPRGHTGVDTLINRSVGGDDSELLKVGEVDEEEQTLPEITVRGVVVMIILSTIFSSANAYMGLFSGMTIGVSVPAAIVSMAVIYPFGGNILEINAVQTGSSSGSSIATGIIYTLPALVILSDQHLSYIETTSVALIGGVLGIMFSIPLRRALIIENPLTFPEAVATAEVLKLTEISEDRPAQVMILTAGAFVGFVLKFCEAGFLLWDPVFQAETIIGGAYLFYVGVNLSPALLSVGYIVGLPIALVMLIGSVINYWVAIPILHGMHEPGDAVKLWSSRTRYLGVGAMLLGGFGAIIGMLPSLVSAIRSAVQAYRKIRSEGYASVKRTQRDIPIHYIGITLVVLFPCMFGLFLWVTKKVVMSFVMTIFMMIFGFLFSAVGAYMSGVVGSSNSPVSGMTLATILTSSVLLLMFLSPSDNIGPSFAIIIGSVVCCAAAVSGDNLQDLKSGHIIGATPLKQQVMQLTGVLVPALIISPVVKLLIEAYGLEKGEKFPRPLLAPQANLMASVAQSIFTTESSEALPWAEVGIGMGIAAIFIALDFGLYKARLPFRLPVLAAALGMYLPFELSSPIVIGGALLSLAKYILSKLHVPSSAQDISLRNGLLFAAGLITGEAIVGIILAVPISVTGDFNVVAVFGDYSDVQWPGIVIIVLVMVTMVAVVCGKHIYSEKHYVSL